LVCSPQGGIDLHIHTTASDGNHTPNEIIEMARQLHLRAFSITDHDTISGVKEIIAQNLPGDLKFVSGVEISASAPKSFKVSGSLHLLGYGINPNDSGLNKLLVLLRRSRDHRIPRILDRLNQLGIHLNIAEIKRQAKKSVLGRPHIAKALVANGYASSVDDAFNRFLGKQKPAYVDKFRLPCQKAIKAIDNAGGIAVLAHPFLVDQNFEKIETLTDLLIPFGLAGIEGIYPEHPKAAVFFYKSLAKRKGLLITGGTDFHGPNIRPGVELGSAKGNFYVPYTLYQQLEARLKQYQINSTKHQLKC
jgi:predicted metal-dependent phosphoesterase TrpH